MSFCGWAGLLQKRVAHPLRRTLTDHFVTLIVTLTRRSYGNILESVMNC
jgi:hypothetical protein